MPFDSPDLNLGTLLEDVQLAKVQLPDFQREWKWDDPRIASLLATITLGYPIGVVMMLETGGDGIDFAPKPIAGVDDGKSKVQAPEQLLLDGQQRLTSLFQALKSQRSVTTCDPRGKRLQRWYYIDIAKALDSEADREEAIISVPADQKLRDNFGKRIIADYSTVEAQCAADVFPLWLSFDNPAIFHWLGVYNAASADRMQRWNEFYDRVLKNVITYTVPVIILKKATPKEAVCTVFEKVNTGGVPLNVFELLTATFAADKDYKNFRLNDDWKARTARLSAKKVLRSVQNTDFLQAITLLASFQRRKRHLQEGGDPAQAPGVTCKRRDILRMKLAEYRRWAPQVEDALMWASTFLAQQRVFRAEDLPYQTQLVPLAAIKVTLGDQADYHSVNARLRQWYWCGVLGELYGGTTETRFARDLEQVVPWALGDDKQPNTVAEAAFQAQRLLTLRTRNSAAYKGIHALLMHNECLDWIKNQPLNVASFFDFQVDIHHVFPKAWCERNHVDPERRESIVNKTPLSYTTNRKIGGRSPSEYVKTIEAASGLTPVEQDKVFATHCIEPASLRTADFDAYFAARREALLFLIGEAMGKEVVRQDGSSEGNPEAFEDEAEDIDDTA